MQFSKNEGEEKTTNKLNKRINKLKFIDRSVSVCDKSENEANFL